MTETAAKRKRPNYGIDAPTAVRNLILGGAAALVLAVVSYLLDWGLTRMATGRRHRVAVLRRLDGLGQQGRQAVVRATACSTASTCGATRRCSTSAAAAACS